MVSLQHSCRRLFHSAQALMAALAAVAAIIALILASSSVVAAPPGWTPAWSDEFNGSTLDTVKWHSWQPSTPGPYNGELQEYLPSQVAITDGNLVLTATNEPYQSQYGSYAYRSGRVESNYGQHYGRFEIRADLPGTKGTWPALWLLPDVNQYPWPTQGEIDILENKGNEPTVTSSAFHFQQSGQPRYVTSRQSAARFGQADNYHNSFHTYAVEWDATKIRYFVDDVHWYTTYNTGTYTGTSGVTVNGALAAQSAPMQVVLNLAVGGSFLEDQQPDATSVWPQQLLVDYVRIFNRDNSPIRLQNGGFEKNGGALAGWSVFGSRLNTNNVQVHNEAVADGATSVKLFGQFTGQANVSGISQGITVAAGDQVTASAKSFIRSQDSLTGTSNTVQMKIEFYNDFGGRSGSSAFISEVVSTIANGSTINDVWRDHAFTAIAPAGAVEARLSFVFNQTAANGGGAIHIDDVSFRDLNVLNVADADGDGDVDGDDFLVWQRHLNKVDPVGPAEGDFNFDGAVDNGDLDVWKQQSPPPAAPAKVPSAASVPEPSAAVLTLTTLAGLINFRAASCRHAAMIDSML
jgi:beta-glucanase (GH16 family)